jgi:hypothetical protein
MSVRGPCVLEVKEYQIATVGRITGFDGRKKLKRECVGVGSLRDG